MTWWIRTRRLPLILLVTAGFWAVALLAGNISLPLPQLGGATSANVPLVLFAPLAPAIALNTGYGTPAPIEATAVRRTAAFDTLLAVAVVLATAAVTAGTFAAGWTGGADDASAGTAARNLACYTGLALVGRATLGNHASTVVPTVLALAVSVFGYGPEQTAHWWAWPAADPSDVLSWAGSAALLVIGLQQTAQGDRPHRR
ncbi:hypothetical protein [Streptomyces mutabilis]|uniref:Uncharacterized protein n=1 Tax=Streptomyces mutabilis TaxID=67332 RepID=A0A086MXG5_9ACTN|nr:hypothetical protein [Streptomyces mutabilis]KFG73583.1 hypothetical protein FM21_22570 [Streptomyces mutabilis]